MASKKWTKGVRGMETSEDIQEMTLSTMPLGDKIRSFATFLSEAKPDGDRALLDLAMESLVHLQFKHRKDRGYGMIVTEDEYRAVRNVVWQIDKGIFWDAVGRRLLHTYDETRDQWVVFDDASGRWEGFDARDFKAVKPNYPASWRPWTRVFNDDRAPHYQWFEGVKTNLSFNALDRTILQHREPHFYRYWESESWGDDQPREILRFHHRAYLFEVTRLVAALKNLGIGRKDRVALLMPEIPEAYYLIEAFHRMGVLFTSLPTSLGDQQVSDRIENLGVGCVFTVASGWHKGKAVHYKRDLLDRALGGFSGKDHARRALQELLKEDPPSRPDERMGDFEQRFENKVTVNKQDFLEFISASGFPAEAVASLENRLHSAPERVDKVIVLDRGGEGEIPIDQKRDMDWSALVTHETEDEILEEASQAVGRAVSRDDFLDYGVWEPDAFLKVVHRFAPPEIVEGNDPRLVIYTSGSTGIPKGVVHRTFGHAVFGMYTMLVTMAPRPWESMDTRATHSWITGLDYIAGMPGLMGIESIVAEGAFDYSRWLKRLDRLGVQISKAGAPVLRGIRKYMDDEGGRRFADKLDLSNVRICVNCAEPADPATQATVNRIIGLNRYVNTWWPTELTGPNTGAGTETAPFAHPMKDDASTYPLPYVKQDVLDDEVDAEDNVIRTRPQAPGILGRYVIDPHPGMLSGIYGDEEKFFEAYFKRYWGKTGLQVWYDSGDGAIRHEDGSFHIIGRVGYAFNWNGHISGAEDVEGTLRDHPAVKDVMIAPIKGEGENLDRLQVFAVLNDGYSLDDRLKREFDDFVVSKKQKTFKGLMTKGSDYYPVRMYPVTMSQKSLRRFGSMLGSLSNKQLREIIEMLADPGIRAQVEAGEEKVINEVFPTRKDVNPYAGSLVGLGNYPSLVHLAQAMASARGLV